MADNPLKDLSPTAGGPAQGFVNITPADANLPQQVRWVKVTGAAGTIRYTGLSGDVINETVEVGDIVDGWIARVHATGTTATGLVGAL
jgi:hypothetical protein